MQPGHIEIFSTDPARSRQFYCDALGFELVAVQSEHYFWVKKGFLEILIRPGNPPAAVARYEDASSGLVLYTDDLAGALDSLQTHGVQIKGTVDSPKCYTFTDPDGNWLQLVDPNDH